MDKFDLTVSEYVDQRFSEVLWLIPHGCESPIELGLLKGFLALWLFDRSIRFEGMPQRPLATEWSATVSTQHEVGQYRLDFAVIVSASAGGRVLSEVIGVECDGHEFHEKTKEQVARDKARDRFITSEGIRLLRFSGSEIYRDNIGCARSVLSLAAQLYGDWADQ